MTNEYAPTPEPKTEGALLSDTDLRRIHQRVTGAIRFDQSSLELMREVELAVNEKHGRESSHDEDDYGGEFVRQEDRRPELAAMRPSDQAETVQEMAQAGLSVPGQRVASDAQIECAVDAWFECADEDIHDFIKRMRGAIAAFERATKEQP